MFFLSFAYWFLQQSHILDSKIHKKFCFNAQVYVIWTFTPKVKADSSDPCWSIVTLQCVFSSVLPAAAVIWRSCIAIFSLKTALWSPPSYKEEIYWEILQNYIFWIVLKLWFSFLSPTVAWLLYFWLYLSFPAWKPAARNLSSPYPAAQSMAAATQTCSWSFSSSIKSSQISKGFPSEWRQVHSLLKNHSTFQTQWSTRMHKKIHVSHYHYSGIPPFSSS